MMLGQPILGGSEVSTVLDEQLVATRNVEAMYLSRREDLRLVRIPRYPQHAPSGLKIGESRGQAIQFRGAQFVVPKDAPLVLDNGDEITDEEEKAAIIAWLDTHKLQLDDLEGFWRIDPAAPPVSAEEQRTLGRLNRALDVAGLERFIAQEEEGWAREALLDAARADLQGVRETLANAPVADEKPKAK
jgi:hypothetical protein